jgi:light-regulated signal transduction histidine kinase (bacteriophytochrome)/CheY-like chemotaxis protein
MRLDGRTTLRGLTPSVPQFEGLLAYLRDRDTHEIYARHEIAAVYPPGRDFADRAAGMMVLPLSRPARDFLIFFRQEAARTVAWAGDPAKPGAGTPDAMPGPRRSFAKWLEAVRFQALPWRRVECRIAEALRVSLLDLILRLSDLTAAEQRRSQQRQELLIAELNHRLRNILGLIRGIISQSADIDQSVEAFAAVIGGRIQALARAHDQITADRWGPALFTVLVAAEADAYRVGAEPRVRVTGADALISPDAFTTIALVLHEMMTNSAKYGALSARNGRVEIATGFDALGRYVIAWSEHGGPPVKPPQRKGFGSTVIERSIGHDLKGDARLDFAAAGLRAEFVIPAAYARAADAQPRPPRVPGTRLEASLAVPDDVLVVEDNMIIALDAEAMVRKLGVASVRLASNTREAFDLIAERRPDFALLDVNLGNETSFAIAGRLIGLGVPFAFASGYGEQVAFPEAVAAMPRLRKPYALETLREVMRGLVR